MRPVITTDKHYVQWTLSSLGTAGTKTEEVLTHAVLPKDKDLSSEVVVGSIIKAVYVELWITSDDTGQGSFSISLEKVPGSTSGFSSYAQSIALNAYTNKKNVLYTTQGLTGPFDEFPQLVFKGWVKIPKGKQRQGLDDYLVLNISTISNGLVYCGFATYKEYT